MRIDIERNQATGVHHEVGKVYTIGDEANSDLYLVVTTENDTVSFANLTVSAADYPRYKDLADMDAANPLDKLCFVRLVRTV